MLACGPRHNSLLRLSIASAQRNAGILKPKPTVGARAAIKQLEERLPQLDIPLDVKAAGVQAASVPEVKGEESEQAGMYAPLPVEPSLPDFHTMTYFEWGEPDSPRTIVCVHGFARNGRDFDRFGESLTGSARVVCPDIVGRGRSGRLNDPPLDGAVMIGGVVLADYGYNYAQFQLDVTALIARLGVNEVDWVGTSLGGSFLV